MLRVPPRFAAAQCLRKPLRSADLRDALIGSLIRCCRVPFGPLTVTDWPSIVTSTPEGTVIGSFPMRDMPFLLPHHT